ncbi:hypothetical protein MNV49_000076 [Pseudohyphozyma bogoriensis]|nr:hypothetical protein MNV49_000076 [Pseudohyphozyma bogoriensis]
MAPYASTYPRRSEEGTGPVRVTLGTGLNGTTSEALIEVELLDEPEREVVQVVRELRESHEFDAMAVDLPWEVLDYSGALERPTLCVPHVVLAELDGLKSSSRLTDSALVPSANPQDQPLPRRSSQSTVGSLSRAATNWMLSVLPTDGSSGVVRGQRESETLLERVNGRTVAESNDMKVLDMALYFKSTAEAGTRVVLLSDDRNLCVKARVEQVDTVSLNDRLTPRALLQLLDPIFASSCEPAPSSSAAPSPSELPLPPRTPPRQHSSPSLAPRPRLPPPDRPSPKPIPLSKEPESMEMDIDRPLPPLNSIPAPLLREPVRTPGDVFANLADMVAHFLSLPLYRHITSVLQETSPASRSRWQQELGDWRYWEAKDAVQVVKRCSSLSLFASDINLALGEHSFCP